MIVAGAADLRARLGAAGLRPAAVGRRRHRTDLPAALVLVAHQRLERDRRDGELVRRRRPASSSRRSTGTACRRTSRCWPRWPRPRWSGSAVTFLTRPTDAATLVAFYRLVRPAGPRLGSRCAPRPGSGRRPTACRRRCSAGCSAASSCTRRCSGREAFSTASGPQALAVDRRVRGERCCSGAAAAQALGREPASHDPRLTTRDPRLVSARGAQTPRGVRSSDASSASCARARSRLCSRCEVAK